jgi:hypothetical protein
MNIIFIIGCNEKTSSDDSLKNKQSSNQQQSPTLVPPPDVVEIYSPLTLAKFTAIHNGTDNFADITIVYSKHPVDGDLSNLGIDAGLPYWNIAINDVESYSGSLNEWLDNELPYEYNYYEHNFTPTEVEEIYSYLENHGDYFFNNEEYEGIYPPPVESKGGPRPVCFDERYTFSLIFSEPGKRKESWAIHKCVDELYPDHPMFGLAQLLEDDFISQFE